jgi:hypothetical protein
MQLGKYRDQLKKLKSGPTRKQVESRAMQVLKQKRMYEKQRDQVSGQVFNIDQAKFAQVFNACNISLIRSRSLLFHGSPFAFRLFALEPVIPLLTFSTSFVLYFCTRFSGVHQGLDRHGAGHEGYHSRNEIPNGRVRHWRH